MLLNGIQNKYKFFIEYPGGGDLNYTSVITGCKIPALLYVLIIPAWTLSVLMEEL